LGRGLVCGINSEHSGGVRPALGLGHEGRVQFSASLADSGRVGSLSAGIFCKRSGTHSPHDLRQVFTSCLKAFSDTNLASATKGAVPTRWHCSTEVQLHPKACLSTPVGMTSL